MREEGRGKRDQEGSITSGTAAMEESDAYNLRICAANEVEFSHEPLSSPPVVVVCR
jgi:hypothetical protein